MHDDADRGTPIDRSAGDGTAKRAYQKPRMEDFGSVVEMTRTGEGTVSDGGSAFASSGAAG